MKVFFTAALALIVMLGANQLSQASSVSQQPQMQVGTGVAGHQEWLGDKYGPSQGVFPPFPHPHCFHFEGKTICIPS